MPFSFKRRADLAQAVYIKVRQERRTDAPARESLLDQAFGPGRFAKASERLREGRTPALSLVARRAGRLVGTVRLWPVTTASGHTCLLLGPLAVAADVRSYGIGASLMRQALHEAAVLGHRAVVLVGDAAYYTRFGFSADKTGALRMPGPYERDRLLACELVPDALTGARGLITATIPPRSRLSQLIDRVGEAAIAQPA
ncbi:N-acetyltransferase [Bradyrhizobium genosp. L]|uniref:GNAT family N-acetyltransferase n=1 Tax=Bradyrhizobium genosp. L TaxID=83637 RepID=UPI0018A24E2D|nr:N-acetyltransferase [Bradyrhizobium genosp. L]QPF85546.1 N-acetyltransferase [Bradyrhizobium genosp. L]